MATVELTRVTKSATLTYDIHDDVWSSSYVADQLFIEMCERGPMIDNPASSDRFAQINKYYLQAAKYAGRISAGDFSNPGIPKPIFELDVADFSPALRSYLLLAKKDGGTMLNDIVKEAAFKLFRARHKMIFYEYIESQKFGWEFVNST
jgi:hypothetical protein